MPFAVPISIGQLVALWATGFIFIFFLLRAFARRGPESGGQRDARSRTGIIVQSVGIGITGLGPVRPTLSPLGPAGLAGTIAVVLLIGCATALFVVSSRELGRNWSLVARMRSDHQLIRTGPYAYVRHPIYLGLMLFTVALAIALGHWIQLVIGLPFFLLGTVIRTRSEDRLLGAQFGEDHARYVREVPAFIPFMRLG